MTKPQFSIWMFALLVSVMAGFSSPPLVVSAQEVTMAKDVIDHAAKQSDRWMLIAVSVILVGGLIWDKMNQAKTLALLFSELRNDRKETDKVLQANTVAITRMMDKFDQ